MSENSSRIYLKMGEIEFSIEGSPAYVQEQYKQMAKDLNLQQKLQGTSGKQETSETKKRTQPQRSQSQRTQQKSSKKATETTSAEQDLSQWLSNIPKGTKNNDIILVSGFLNQLKSRDNTFRVRDISNTLKENEIKMTNPSNLLNYILKRKNVIKQVKKERGRNYFQVTNEGEKRILELLKGQPR